MTMKEGGISTPETELVELGINTLEFTITLNNEEGISPWDVVAKARELQERIHATSIAFASEGNYKVITHPTIKGSGSETEVKKFIELLEGNNLIKTQLALPLRTVAPEPGRILII